MLRVKTIVIFLVNIGLILLGLVTRGVTMCDEYLVIFTIPILCIIASFVCTLKSSVILFTLNVLFFCICIYLQMFARIDAFFLTLTIFLFCGTGYFLKKLNAEIEDYYKKKIDINREEYMNLVKDLEGVERKGRIVESELTRISRLYEITKQLGPTLKFDDFVKAMFSFVENNFRFDRAHIFLFKKEKYMDGLSKNILKNSDAPGSEKTKINYTELYSFVKKEGYKSLYVEKKDDPDIFPKVGIKSDAFMVFPFMSEEVVAVLVVEGATKLGFSRFNLIVPQISLELRKVWLYERVETLSIMDGLTGVYLRRYLIERLEEEIERAKRLGLTFSVGMIDIDRFKECNDTYGHLVGDAVLKEVSDRFKAMVREVDMIARYGGEEFCILLPETAKDLAITVAERLRESVDFQDVKAFEESIKTTVSVGIATFPEDGEDLNTIIERADAALYRAKRAGRNRVFAA